MEDGQSRANFNPTSPKLRRAGREEHKELKDRADLKPIAWNDDLLSADSADFRRFKIMRKI